MKSLGQQVIAEFYDCDPDVLNDCDVIERVMCEAALKAGATIVGKTFHIFSAQGVSGAVVSTEFHLAIHTWPEFGYAAVDLFTCGDAVEPEACYRYLKGKLSSRHAFTVEMKRGQLEVMSELRHRPAALKQVV
jgi:S-adenosylmethionine decarboxylase proenzyme